MPPRRARDHHAVAHVAFVEAYAVGPRAIQRVEDSHIAFTIFLQEGYRYQPQAAPPPSRLALEAIITTIFEIVYLQARASNDPQDGGASRPLRPPCARAVHGGALCRPVPRPKARPHGGSGGALPLPRPHPRGGGARAPEHCQPPAEGFGGRLRETAEGCGPRPPGRRPERMKGRGA